MNNNKYAKYSKGPVTYGSNGHGAMRVSNSKGGNIGKNDSCGNAMLSFLFLAVTAISLLIQYV